MTGSASGRKHIVPAKQRIVKPSPCHHTELFDDSVVRNRVADQRPRFSRLRKYQVAYSGKSMSAPVDRPGWLGGPGFWKAACQGLWSLHSPVLLDQSRWSPHWPFLPALSVPIRQAGVPRPPLPLDKRSLFLDGHRWPARCVVRAIRASPVR